MYYYQWWTGREQIENVCIVMNVGQGETKYKMYVLLSMLDRGTQNTKCIIINVGQGDTKYKIYVLLSTLDRGTQNTKYMYYYQRWTE